MKLDPRSAEKVATLRPKARPYFDKLYQLANADLAEYGLKVVFTSGNRTWAEQDALFAQGRTTPGEEVTNARGGQSMHNYEFAVDATIFKGSKPVWESPHYDTIGKIGESIGLEWGGRWKSIVDKPHFQIRTGRKASELRALVNSKGWGAIDALIPTFKGTNEPPATLPDAIPTLIPVAVHFDDLADGKPSVQFDIAAYLMGGSTWVEGASFCDYFGGAFKITEPTKPGGEDGGAEVELNGDVAHLRVVSLKGKNCVKFSELNESLGVLFSFDGKLSPKRLTIHRDTQDGK